MEQRKAQSAVAREADGVQGSGSGSASGSADDVLDVDAAEQSTKPTPAYRSGSGSRGKTSAVWKHFTQTFKGEDGNDWVTCCHPGKDGLYKKVAWSGTMSNLMKYLRVHHKNIYSKEMEDGAETTINTGDDQIKLNAKPKASFSACILLCDFFLV